MTTLGGWIIRKLLEKKKKQKQQPPPPPPRREEEEPPWYQELREHAREALRTAHQQFLRARRTIEEYIKKNPDDRLVKEIYERAKKAPERANFWNTIVAIALAEALQRGHHDKRDPTPLIRFILAYNAAILRQLRHIPHIEKYMEIEPSKREEVGKIGSYGTYVHGLLYIVLEDKIGRRDISDKIVPAGRKFNEMMRSKVPLDIIADTIVDEYERAGLTGITQLYNQLLREMEEEAGEKPPLEETGARELLKIALRETLPGWALKQALDQAKAPLYTDYRGVHPSYVKYHLQRSSPEHPLGTALHTLVTRTLSEWEREAAQDKNPSHPYDLLATLLGKPPEELAKKEITEEEASRIAQALGIPRSITPSTLKMILQELARDLRELKEGKKTAHQLDAEKEAAMRYHQLHPYAQGEPSIDPVEHLRRNKNIIMDTYRNIKAQALQEIQLGREEHERLLQTLEEKLPSLLDELADRLERGERISRIVADQTTRLREELGKEIGDPLQLNWLTNLARNILLDAPIITVARDPALQYAPMEEKQRAAAALLRLYEEEGKKHNTAPVAADLHSFWEIIKDKKGREALEEIERIRSRVNAVGNLATISSAAFNGLLDGTRFNRWGLLDHKVITELAEAKKRLMESTSTRIARIKRQEKR